MNSSSTSQQRWFLTLLSLSTIAIFLLLHPYRGLIHDGRLYTFQALSYLHPGLYGNDIFIRLGSQDDYTFFSPLYAWLISPLGVERAAAVLTLISMCLFLLAAWMLARALLTQKQAAVALLLLLIIPSHYGSSRVFHYLEEFVTPRQFSEALVLFCLVAWLKDKRLLAAALSVAAVLIHPLIGLSGVAVLITLRWVLAYPLKVWLPGIAGALLILALSGWLPIARWQFDAQWYEIVKAKTYLVLLDWDTDDWSRVATVLATLVIAGMSLRDQLRRLALAAFIVSASLLVVALVGGDLLRITIVVQAQTWRVMWLATVLAILLLPPIFARVWHSGPMGRCSALLLAASWASSHSMTPLVTGPLAIVATAFAMRPIQIEHPRLLVGGAWLALATIVVHNAATAQLSWGAGLIQFGTLPSQLDRFLTLCQNGLIPALALLIGCYVFVRLPSQQTMATLSVLTLAIIAIVVVPVTKTWASARYTKEVHEMFSGWREHIPPGSDVMWAGDETGGGDGATNTWLLLERPSFVSSAQAPNALFSRAAAIEMHSRAQQLWGRLPFMDPFRPVNENISDPASPLRLTTVCAASSVRYIVTPATLIDAVPIAAPASAPLDLRHYKLYICT